MAIPRSIILLCALMFGISLANAQQCLELKQDEVRELIAEGAPGRPKRCEVWCDGCGCKGGPGYRDSFENCVSYRNLISACGAFHDKGCKPECFPVVAGCVRPDIEGAKERAKHRGSPAPVGGAKTDTKDQ